MMKLRLIGFIFVIFFFFSLIVSAQIDDAQKKIDEAAENLEKNVTAIRGFTQADYWENVGAQWKEVLLKNKFIGEINSFFTSINVVFVILFGMDWSLSLNMFFAFLFWIIMLVIINKYMASINKSGIGFLYSLIIVVLLAQINLFEYVGKWSVALLLYKGSVLWRSLFFLGILGLFVGFWALNRGVAKWIKKKRDEWNSEVEKDAKMTFVQWVKAATGGDWRTTKKFN